MSYTIASPYRYKERLCLYGYAGAGKSTAILNILRFDPTASAYVIDLDYSFAYQRLIDTEYQDVADRVHVFTIDADLDAMRDVFAGKTPADDGFLWTQADPVWDWIVIDPTTQTWKMVQDWWIGQSFGEDIGLHFAQLKMDARARVASGEGLKTRAKTEDAEYSADVANDMQWPIINKLYEQHFYKHLHRWRGHMILVCEADTVRNDAKPEEKDQYSFIGHKPKGQKTLPYVAATNIYLDHPSKSVWRMTSAKDRGRALMDKTPVDNFAFDYLVNIAGWQYFEWDDETGEAVDQGGGAR